MRKYILIIIFIPFLLGNCSQNDSLSFEKENIYISGKWENIGYFDFTPSSTNTGSPLKKTTEFVRITNDKDIDKAIYDKYTSILQRSAKGKRNIYLKYKKEIDQYGNKQEVTEYLCTIDIDELKKYKTYDNYLSGGYGKNSFLRAYEEYKRNKGVH